MDLNVKGAKTPSIAEGDYSIPVNAQNVGTPLPLTKSYFLNAYFKKFY